MTESKWAETCQTCGRRTMDKELGCTSCGGAWCTVCGVEHEFVRPGKTQPRCRCEEVTTLKERVEQGIMLIEQSRGHSSKTGRNLILDDAIHALKGEPETAWTSYHKRGA